MSRFLRYLARALLALIVLVAIAVAAGTIYMRTESFGRLLRDQVNRLGAISFRGQLVIGQIDTSIWGDLTIHDLRIQYRGAGVVLIPRLRVSYSLIPSLWRELRLQISAFSPMIRLERDGDGTWNLAEAVAFRTPTTSSGTSAFAVYLEAIVIEDAIVEIAPQGPRGKLYRLDRANLEAHILILPTELKVHLSNLHSHVAGSGMPGMEVNAIASYEDDGSIAEARVDTLRMTTANSAISLMGTLKQRRALQVDAKALIERAAATDLSQIVSAYPFREDLKGNITFKGPVEGMHIESALTAGSAQLSANVYSDFTKKILPFDGRITLTRLDLRKLSLSQELAGVVDATFVAQGEGTDPHALIANARVSGHDITYLTFYGGDLQFSGSARHGNATFIGNLTNGPGRVTLDGNAVVAANPSYHIVVSSHHLDAARILTSAPKSDLNSELVLDGRGIKPEKINATIGFRATRSVVAGVSIDSASMTAGLIAGRVKIDPSRIQSQGTIVNFAGTSGIAEGAKAQIAYQVQVSQMTPWLKLGGIAGDGRVNLQGTATGILQGANARGLGAQGTIDFDSLRISSLSVATGDANYNFTGIGQDLWPGGNASAQLTTVLAGNLKLRTLGAQMQIDPGRTPRIHLALKARDSKDHDDNLAAQIIYQRNRIVGSIDRLLLVLSDGNWRLAQPAQFTKDSRGFTLEHFEVRNGERALALDAELARSGMQRVSLHADAIDLGVLAPLLSQGQQIAGTASGDVLVTGTSSAPLINATLHANDIALNSQRIGDLSGTIEYGTQGSTVDVALHQDRSHQIRITGTVPLTLNWANGFAARIGNNQKLRVYTAGLRLAPFSGVLPRTLKNAVGLLQIDLQLSGPLMRPIAIGTVGLIHAGVEVVPLGSKVTDLETQLRISPTRLEITELSARSGAGTLNGDGSIAVRNYSPGAINGHLDFHKWQAIATEQYRADIDGRIDAEGNTDAPRLRGQIEVLNGSVHPDLAFLNESSELEPDNTIVVIQPGERIPGYTSGASSPGNGSSGAHPPSASSRVFKRLALDIRVDIPRNTWIRHEDTEVELEGALYVKKRRGGPAEVVGRIETVRGWLYYHTRRFTLASGQILFTGGPDANPSLDIDAQYAISSYAVDIVVSGTAKKPILKLQSQPPLAQADILSLILFGATTNQLGQGQRTALRQQAQLMATGAAAATVGQAISETLGLESLGVSLKGGSVGFGRYLSENTYISLSPSLAKNTTNAPTQRASIQYFFKRWVSVTTSTMSDGSSQIFLNISKRY